jgi:aminomethyltransferase
MSPMLKIGVGMGYVKPGFAKVGTEIYLSIRGKLIKAKVAKLPFYKG